MKNIILGLLVFFCAIYAASAQRFDPIDINDLPRAQPDDKILVVMLEAPLFFAQYGHLMEYFNLYHAGVGFVNTNTRTNWTVEYDALPTFAKSVIPEVVQNGTSWEIVAKNIGGAILYLGINSTYWNHQTVVAVINGTVHNNYIEWLRASNASHPNYNLFNVYSKWSDNVVNDRVALMPGFTCADFMWESFDAIHHFGGQFFDLKKRRNYMNFYASELPIKVNYWDPAHHDKIVKQFMTLEGKFKQLGIFEFLLGIVDMLAGEIYLRFFNDFYYIKEHHGFNFKYALTPLPGQQLNGTLAKVAEAPVAKQAPAQLQKIKLN